MLSELILIYLLFNWCIAQNDWPNEISIGILSSNITLENGIDFTEGLYTLIANDTINELHKNEIIPTAVKINIYTNSLDVCNDVESVDSFMSIWERHNPSVYFGPECSAAMYVAGLLASHIDKPIFDYSSITYDLSDRIKYKTTVRIFYTMKYLAQAIKALLIEYDWMNVAVVRTIDLERCDIFLGGIGEAFLQTNITIVNDICINTSNDASVQNGFNILKSTTRIILLCAGPSPSDASDFLKLAYQNGLVSPEYAIIVPYFRKMSVSPWEPWSGDNREMHQQSNKLLKSYYQNTIIIQTAGDLTDKYNNYTKKVQSILDVQYKTAINFSTLQNYMLRLAPLHDAIFVYLKMVNHSIEKNISYMSGIDLAIEVASTEFTGVTGRVVFDDAAERVSNYEILQMNNNSEFATVLEVGVKNSSAFRRIEVVNNPNQPVWRTIDNLPPKSIPICGFRAELCQPSSSSLSTSVGVTVAIIAFIISAAFAAFIYQRNSFEKKLFASSWKLDLNKFQLLSRNHHSSAYSNLSKLDKGQQNSVKSSICTYDIATFSDNTEVNGKFEGCGMYHDTLAAVRRWPKHGIIILHDKQILELQAIKELSHDNINRFIGFSTDAPHSIMCLWGYCTKRSLHDIIFNDDIHLDISFQISILRDISAGLEYLQSSKIGFHGRLYLTNCLVDSRWVVKLTDFGINRVIDEINHSHEKTNDPLTDLSMDKMLCTAPEILRQMTYIDYKAADVYQFGMIAYHVLFREEPFSNLQKSSEEVLAVLQNKNVSPIRPFIKAVEGCDTRVLRIIGVCLHVDAAARPKALEIKKEIFSATKTFGKNLMDHAMSMLEKYATNLENIVAERTSQLNEERKRADHLLYQMLPKSVADSLKAGQPIAPETFDCATVYFSDVVGFTNICSQSTPDEVVIMLNLLYTQFDECISMFNAYKVETIGDAYLVVSGLPARIGMKHVTEIADMSLKILKVLLGYTIPHLPHHKLMVRIGIHSGPVAGGVVGLSMPRYCLFGDTVNYASRMESTGEGGKIQITEETRNLLVIHKDVYVMQLRGEISVKGKGNCRTYWLLDKKEKQS